MQLHERLSPSRSVSIVEPSMTERMERDESLDSKVFIQVVGERIERSWQRIGDLVTAHLSTLSAYLHILLLTAYNVYLAIAVYHANINGIPFDWCKGVGMLILLTVVFYTGWVYSRIIGPRMNSAISKLTLKQHCSSCCVSFKAKK